MSSLLTQLFVALPRQLRVALPSLLCLRPRASYVRAPDLAVCRTQELVFIGMKPAAAAEGRDPQELEARNAARRKLLQAENRRELERDVEAIKAKVHETEGLDMRETVQDKINSWFVENRHPETGEYPDFPDHEDGGYGDSPALLPCAEYIEFGFC